MRVGYIAALAVFSVSSAFAQSLVPPPAPPGVAAAPSTPLDDDDRNRPSYEPPKMTGGDPLAG